MNLTLPHGLYFELGAVIALAVIIKAMSPTKKHKSSKPRGANHQKKSHSSNRPSSVKRADAEILRSPIEKLTWA